MRIRIDPVRGEVELVLPNGAAQEDGERFLVQQQDWIDRELAALKPRRPFIDGARVPVLGRDITISHRSGPGEAHLEGNRLIVGGAADHLSWQVTVWLSEQAGQALREAALRHAEALRVRFARIRINDPRSRWGSCSSRGTLSFSWRLVMAPERVLNYVAAHEVAHLREANHSERFWQLVEMLDPAYRPARAWLKRHGNELHRYGA